MDFDILYQGDFINIVSPKDHPYEAVLERDLVLILPIIKGKIGLRLELCPPYLIRDATKEERYYTIISGGIEEEEDPKKAMTRELREESGVIVKKGRFVRLFEKIAYTKVTASRVTLFVVFVEEYEEEKIEGDGTEYEEKSKTIWLSFEEFEKLFSEKKNIDFLLVSAFFILKGLFNK